MCNTVTNARVTQAQPDPAQPSPPSPARPPCRYSPFPSIVTYVTREASHEWMVKR